MLKKSFFLVFAFLPITCWAFIKPARILAPEWNGLSCITNEICVEDKANFARANELYVEAIKFVNGRIDHIDRPPKVAFCTTEICFRSFGFSSPAKAKILGTYGVVVGPEGWKDYIIRHEFIHHLQSERLGVFSQWATDDWFTEGMAYSMSGDPRALNKKWSGYRKRFEYWYSQIKPKEIWLKAKQL